jgi:hypothetical protein
MYDYQAQIPEEFSFQADDIIAVFATDPDGWWQGELLDDTRKRMGGTTFPSNFWCVPSHDSEPSAEPIGAVHSLSDATLCTP